MYEIVKHYRNHTALRRSFNELAQKTFGLDFEGWYQNGFWSDAYDPYSVVVDGRVVANVSVNRTDMLIGGQRKRLYQLGTVMTDEAFRNRGLIRAIMAEINRDTSDAGGVYLFANDFVLDFYPKFGFRPGKEYLYSQNVAQAGACRMERVSMACPENWARLKEAMENCVFRSGCDMVGNPGLIFFYVSQFMQESVYRCGALDAWVIADMADGELFLHNVFCSRQIPLDAVIGAFGSGVRRVSLGFAPADATGFEVTPYHEEDCTFFVRGSFFNEFEEKRLRIPSLSHA